MVRGRLKAIERRKSDFREQRDVVLSQSFMANFSVVHYMENQQVMTSLSVTDMNNTAEQSMQLMQPAGSLVHFLVHLICQVSKDTKNAYKSRHYF